MVVLAGHRPEATHLPEQPLCDVDLSARLVGEKHSGLFSEIKQNSAGFEHRNWLAAIPRAVVDNSWNAVIRGNRQEFWFELITLADVDRDDPVGQCALFQKHRDLVSVRGRPVMKIDHRVFFLLRPGKSSSASAGRTAPSSSERFGTDRARTRTPRSTPSSRRAVSFASTPCGAV